MQTKPCPSRTIDIAFSASVHRRGDWGLTSSPGEPPTKSFGRKLLEGCAGGTWLDTGAPTRPRLDYQPTETGAQGAWHGYGTASATLTTADQPRKARRQRHSDSRNFTESAHAGSFMRRHASGRPTRGNMFPLVRRSSPPPPVCPPARVCASACRRRAARLASAAVMDTQLARSGIPPAYHAAVCELISSQGECGCLCMWLPVCVCVCACVCVCVCVRDFVCDVVCGCGCGRGQHLLRASTSFSQHAWTTTSWRSCEPEPATACSAARACVTV